MRTTLTTMVLNTALCAAAFAQSYSQPVREVDKEARSAVRGICQVSMDAGTGVKAEDCILQDLSQNLGGVVPAGKILVVEDIAANCAKLNTDRTMLLNFRTGGAFMKLLGLQLARTRSNGQQVWVFSQTARMYAKGGERLWAVMETGDPLSQAATCAIRFQGHLVNEN